MHHHRCATLLILLALATLPVQGQTDDESNSGFQFNFSTPGARSLSMGGAFLGSVDDATAAYSNPAGLLQLSKAEALVEGRSWSYSTPYPRRGRASGSPTGLGADRLGGIEQGIAEADLSGVSFASVVFPRKRWALAAYYHQVALFEADFETEGVFAGSLNDGSRLLPVQSTVDLDISQAGLAYAWRWGNGIAVGVGVSGYSFSLDSVTQRFLTDRFFDPVDFSTDRKVNFQQQHGDSEELGYSLGVRWDRSDKMSIGLVYRYGPEFDLSVIASTGSPDLPPSQRLAFRSTDEAVFNLPDVYGLGITYRPTQAWTINVDVNQVLYSELTDDFFVIFEDPDPFAPLPAEDYVIDDATEIHLGIEYVLARGPIPVAFRLGGWFDPDHRLRAEVGSDLNQVRLGPGEDQVHYSVGLGLVVTSHFQLDAAADFSDVYDTLAVSAALRF